MLHGNARPHTTKPLKKYLVEGMKWEILPHPLYSPDIAPSVFHFFRSMQSAISVMKIFKNSLVNGSLQKNQISSFEKFVNYLKVEESCRFRYSIVRIKSFCMFLFEGRVLWVFLPISDNRIFFKQEKKSWLLGTLQISQAYCEGHLAKIKKEINFWSRFTIPSP